ncbi:MAG: hypothetical protein ACI9LY_000317 [Arenicella sp.]|jgi:hypothetical protein
MLNSLNVFLAFLGFLAFGYISLLRTVYGQLFGAPYKELIMGLNSSHGLKHIGSSAFFVSLPATSLLLFWGWGPALIWLVIFHLMADSLVNLQVTAVDHRATFSEYLVGLDSSLASLVMRGLLQLYLLLLMAVVLTMLAQLIDQESGLLFVLVSLIPAYRLLRNGHKSIPKILKIVGAFCLLMVGLLFANQLGVAMYGDWAPLSAITEFDTSQFDWFRLNNTTVLAALLLSGAFMLAHDEKFSDDVSKLAGVVVIATIAILIVKLIWLRPLLDAPMNVVNEAQGKQPLPNLLTFCLFLFAGLTTLFFRVFNSTAPTDDELSPASDFGRLQAESLLQLVLSIVLILCLASALGIGSWKTHFLNWDQSADFISHLKLAISSLLYLIDSNATAGNIMHTAIMAGFCIVGLNFLKVCVKALSLADEERTYRVGKSDSFWGVLVQSKLIQVFLAYLLCTYYIANSVSLNSWLLIGIMGWIIVVQLITAMTVTMQKASFARTVYGAQSLILITLGSIQTLFISTQWAVSGEINLAVFGFSLVAIAVYLWFAPIAIIISRFTSNDKVDYFDLS